LYLFSIAEVNEVAAQPPPEEEEDQNEDQDVPDLTNFTIEELKQYVIQFFFLNNDFNCGHYYQGYFIFLLLF
jgi:hypothetical protein